MKITVNHYSNEIDRVIIETMEINPQTPSEIDSILRDYHVARISNEKADHMVEAGALDLRR